VHRCGCELETEENLFSFARGDEAVELGRESLAHLRILGLQESTGGI
jgi:hypothetical protein